MALAKLIAPFAQVSGRFDSPMLDSEPGSGVVAMPASGNRTYLRRNVIPNQPNSTYQILARAQVVTLSESFQNLTLEQVAGWKALAATMTRENSLGQPYTPTWNIIYLQVNSFRLQRGLALLENAPPPSERPPLVLVSVESDDGSPTQELTVTMTDPAPTIAGAYRLRFSRATTSPVLQIPDNELRIVTSTQTESFGDISGSGPSSVVKVINATRLNILAATNIAVEIVTLDAGGVPGVPIVWRNFPVTAI